MLRRAAGSCGSVAVSGDSRTLAAVEKKFTLQNSIGVLGLTESFVEMAAFFVALVGMGWRLGVTLSKWTLSSYAFRNRFCSYCLRPNGERACLPQREQMAWRAGLDHKSTPDIRDHYRTVHALALPRIPTTSQNSGARCPEQVRLHCCTVRSSGSSPGRYFVEEVARVTGRSFFVGSRNRRRNL